MSVTNRLEELAALHEKGLITDTEYEEAKRAALGLNPLPVKGL